MMYVVIPVPLQLFSYSIIIPLAETWPALGKHVIASVGMPVHMTSRACSCMSVVSSAFVIT